LAENKTGQEFQRVVRRFNYLRRFTPAVLDHLAFQPQSEDHSVPALEAVQTLAPNGKIGNWR
jgi:hypothetical protein